MTNLSKSHSITFNSVSGKVIEISLFTQVTRALNPSKVEFFPVMGIRVNNSTSDFGFGYLNQSVTLDIIDEDEVLYDLFNQNINRDVECRVHYDGRLMFKGYPEVKRIKRVIKSGKQALSITFYTAMQYLTRIKTEDMKLAGKGESNLFPFPPEAADFPWARLIQLFIFLSEYVFEEGADIALTSGMVADVEAGDLKLVNEDVSPSGKYNIFNNTWLRSTSIINDERYGSEELTISEFYIQLSRVFGYRFGWSESLQRYAFFEVSPSRYYNDDSYFIWRAFGNGELITDDIGQSKSVVLDTGTSSEVYASNSNQLVAVGSGSETNVYFRVGTENAFGDLVLSTPTFTHTSVDVATVKGVSILNGNLAIGLESAATIRVRYFNLSSSDSWIYNNSSISNIRDVEMLGDGRVGVSTNSQTIILDGVGTEQHSLLITSLKIRQSVDPDKTILVLTNGVIREYNNDFTSFDEHKFGTNVREIRRLKSMGGYIICYDTTFAVVDPSFNFIKTKDLGADVYSADQLGERDPRIVVSSAVPLGGYITTIYDFESLLSIKTYISAEKPLWVGGGSVLKSEEHALFYHEANNATSVYWPNTNNTPPIEERTLNDLTEAYVDYVVLDENKFSMWPSNTDNPKIVSTTTTRNEYEIEDAGGTVVESIPEAQNTVENTIEPFEKVYYENYVQPINLPWRGSTEDGFNLGRFALKTMRLSSGNLVSVPLRNLFTDYNQTTGSSMGLLEAINRNYLRVRKTNRMNIRGVYSGILDPMIPVKYDGSLFLITQCEFDLRREETIIKKSHQLSNK